MSHALDARASALPRSLAFSSLSYLTVVVLLLLLRSFLVHVAVEDASPPVLQPPINFPGPYIPIPPSPAGGPSVTPAVPTDGPIVPVDDRTHEDSKFDVPTDSPPIVGPLDGQGGVNTPPGPGGGAGGGGAEVPPGTYEYVEVMPTLVTRVTPQYPPIAQQAGLSGEVDLWLRVGADGQVIKVQVMHSNPMFDDAAKAAALQWVFTPATTDGRPVPVWVGQKVRFVLHD